jgi:enterochelin esterase-like enzyme
MGSWIADVPLIGGWLPVVVDVAAIGATLLLLVLLLGPVPPRTQGRPVAGWRRVIAALVGVLAGGAVGLVLCWLLGDQLNLFDVSLTPISRAWVAGAFASLGLAVSAVIVGRRGRRRVGVRPLATVAATAALLAGALGVNADFGQYTTLGSLTNASIAPPLSTSLLAIQKAGAPGPASRSADSARPLWHNAVAQGMPRTGVIGSVTIPATVSHFAARGAYVYLPPAALVSHPVALPVLIMMSGQPGSPGNVISSGRIAEVFDAFAASHDGLAPIVVAPDQLGAPDRNPMCVDGSLGASATYLTVDVPNWIRSHLTVQSSPGAWAIGGFSQGGTCSIQLGAAHAELFSAIVDISGQLAPKNGGLTQTIAIGFGGDAPAYRAALPEAVLAGHAPYRDMVAVFGVGQLDARYGPVAARMTAAASAAGVQSTEQVSPGTGHDWHTVQWVLIHGLDPVYVRLGLLKSS